MRNTLLARSSPTHVTDEVSMIDLPTDGSLPDGAFNDDHRGMLDAVRGAVHRKAERQQLPPPMMRRGAGLHRHDAPRKRVEKLQKRSAIDRAGNDNRARRVDRVNAEDPLGQIKPDARDRRGIDDRLAHGRLPSRWRLQRRPSWHA